MAVIFLKGIWTLKISQRMLVPYLKFFLEKHIDLFLILDSLRQILSFIPYNMVF